MYAIMGSDINDTNKTWPWQTWGRQPTNWVTPRVTTGQSGGVPQGWGMQSAGQVQAGSNITKLSQLFRGAPDEVWTIASRDMNCSWRITLLTDKVVFEEVAPNGAALGALLFPSQKTVGQNLSSLIAEIDIALEEGKRTELSKVPADVLNVLKDSAIKLQSGGYGAAGY